MDKSKLGIVYVLSNPAMPGIVKIGRSDQKDLKQRLRSLFNTSVPLPFKVEFACYVEKSDTKNLELLNMMSYLKRQVVLLYLSQVMMLLGGKRGKRTMNKPLIMSIGSNNKNV